MKSPALAVATAAEALLLPSLAGWAGWLAWHDLRYHRIPNWALTVPAVLMGGWIWAYGHGPFMQSAWDAVLGATLAAGLLLPAYLGGKLGGGDVKLAILIGLLLGPVATAAALLLAALIIGALAIGQRRQRTLAAAPALLGGLMAVVTAPLWAGG